MADIMSNGVYYDKNGNKLEVVDAAARAGVAENKQEIDVLSEANAKLSEEIEELKENGTGGSGGMTAAQIAALNNLFKVAAYIKSDVTAEYGAFKEAFGIAREWEVVRTLKDDEIQGYRGISETYPYTQYREERAGYYAFDILVEANVTYKVEFQPSDGTVLCIPRLWNEDAIDKASRQENIAGTFLDTTWEASGLTVQAPELVKGSPVACMTLSFKRSDESAIPNGTVSNVVIYKYV